MHLVVIILFLLGSMTCGSLLDKGERYAGCLNRCQNLSCKEECYEILSLIQNTTMFNATLHCRDTDVLTLDHNSGIYIIQQSISKNSWGKAKVIQGEISVYLNLNPGQYYRYWVRRVTNEGISQPEVTSWFQTTRMGIKPEEVKRITVEAINPDNEDFHHLQAEIKFQPADDLSCYYDVLMWSEDNGLSIGNVNATRGFRFHLHQLEYSTNNTIIISAKNKGYPQNSNNISTIFKTPSCLKVLQNLTVCAPNKITGLKVVNLLVSRFESNVEVHWDKPEYLPDNYTVRIDSLDDIKEPYIMTVPGNQTSLTYSLDITGSRHLINIVAESQGGISPPASIFNTIEKPEIFNELVIIVSSAGMVIMIFGMTYTYLKHKKSHPDSRYNYCSNLNERAKLAPIFEKSKSAEVENKIENDPLIVKDHFELRPMQLRIKEVLGSGISGIVRLGSLQVNQNESIDVAVKMLKDCPSEDDIRNFHQEILIMKSAGIHQNIVSMIGCCTISKNPMLVVEYCSRGDLQTFLRKIWKDLLEDALDQKARYKYFNSPLKQCIEMPVLNSGNEQEVAISNQLYDIQQDMIHATEDITVADLLSFARQVANGMEFLSMNRIVHRDLAARNVLVCVNRTVKISDFGLSRDIYQENIYKKQGNGKLPIKWMAIEALTHQIYTSQSDVWSFGILLWEIVTLGCNPYPDITTNMILQLLKEGYRMGRPQNCGVELYDMMAACWNTRPRNRPTFTKLKEDLDKLLETGSENEYLNLYDVQPGKISSSDLK